MNEPMDYVDENGTQWIMAACGHRVGGGVKVGQKISLCPNCRFLIRFKSIEVVYPERLDDELFAIEKIADKDCTCTFEQMASYCLLVL